MDYLVSRGVFNPRQFSEADVLEQTHEVKDSLLLHLLSLLMTFLMHLVLHKVGWLLWLIHDHLRVYIHSCIVIGVEVRRIYMGGLLLLLLLNVKIIVISLLI